MDIPPQIYPIMTVIFAIMALFLTAVLLVMVIRRYEKKRKDGIENNSGWPIGIYLIVSVCSAFIVSSPALDGVPPNPHIVQTAAYLCLVWGRLTWAVIRKEKRESSRFYIGLMIIVPILLCPLSHMLLPVYDCLTR